MRWDGWLLDHWRLLLDPVQVIMHVPQLRVELVLILDRVRHLVELLLRLLDSMDQVYQ